MILSPVRFADLEKKQNLFCVRVSESMGEAQAIISVIGGVGGWSGKFA